MTAAPRLASTVMVLRPEDTQFSVLLVKRAGKSGFMAGAHVFPGGRVDDDDGAGDDGMRNAALRETREECGIALDARVLQPWSWWITPEAEPKRFDTRFFIARVAAATQERIDGHEIVDAAWLSPKDALAAYAQRAIVLAPPTLATLEDLLPFADIDAVYAAAPRTLVPVCPVLSIDGDDVVLALPGDAQHPTKARAFATRTRIVRTGAGLFTSQ